MSCGFDKELLTGYFDGELEAAGKAEVERHIGACSECLRELGEIKSAAALVKGLPRFRAPGSLADGVSRVLPASGGRVHSLERSRRRLWWLTAAAAAAFVAVNLSYFLGRPPQQRPGSAAPMLGAVKASKEDRSASAVEAEEKQKSGRRELGEDARKVLEGKDAAVGGAPAALKAEAVSKKELPQDRERFAARRAEQAPGRRAPAEEGEKAPAPAPAIPKPGAPPQAPAAPVAGAPPSKAAPAPVADGLRKAAVPETLTLAWVNGNATRARLDEILAKYTAPKPPPEREARSKKPDLALGAPADPASIVLELTPESFETLKADLEKAGGAKLLALSPEDPELAKLAVPEKGGGVATAKAGAANRGAGLRTLEGERQDSGPEAKVRVRITLVQVRELPAEPAK